MDRRQFIHRAGLAGLTAVFGGCRHDDSPLGDCPDPASVSGILVPQATRESTADSPLRIDIHSHIFNGHDVPMADYFVRAAMHAPPPLDELLKHILVPAQEVIRLLAPTAKKEYDQLCALLATHNSASPTAAADTESLLRVEISTDNDDFAREIGPIANQEPFRTLYREAEQRELGSLGIQSARQLSDEIDTEEIGAALDFRPIQPALDVQGGGITRVARIWPFLKRIASRRYHNAFRLMEMYGKGPNPVDAFAVATVDYDASLQPSTASTTIADQVRLMEAIAILSKGRILPLVGYDPRRDVASGGGALKDVENAITKFSHVGVKLYPVMGFAAYGNGASTLDCEWPNEANYGARIDARLADLYRFAIAKNAPLLAHSNMSNGITKDCQKNGGYADWGRALRTFDGLSACAGHFGGLPKNNDGLTDRMKGFIDLFRKNESRRFFADLAYVPELFSPGSKSGDDLAARLGESTAYGKVSDHLIYGSDWYMLTQHPSESEYASNAVDYLRRVGGDALVTSAFATNPARLLGLVSGSGVSPAAANGSFLSTHGITPHWRTKLAQAGS